MTPSRPLAPSDAVVALRSLPRRFRAALAVAGEERPDDVAHRPGPSGRSAVDELHDAVGAIVASHGQLDNVLRKADPELGPVVGPGRAAPSDASVEGSLAELATAAEALADRVAHVDPSEWERTGRRAGEGKVTALDVVAEAVSRSIEHLRAVGNTMAAVSGAAD